MNSESGCMMKKIVFIEGISGVGKSTVTQKLCNKLREMGFSTDCFLEFDCENPIDFYSTAYFTEDEYKSLLEMHSESLDMLQHNTIVVKGIRLIRYYNKTVPLFSESLLSILREHEFCWKPTNLVAFFEYSRVYKLIWEQFSRNTVDRPDYLLFDGSLLHHPLNDMMRNYHITSDQAAIHINSLIKTVEAFSAQMIYLSVDNIAKRLQKARISRDELPPSEEQIQFWEKRKQMDMSVMQKLMVPYDIFDVSNENWDCLINMMVRHILETDHERQARIYPIILSEYNPAWPQWFAEEKANLERLIGIENIAQINHFGSTSVPGLTAKPTVDILLEIAETVDIEELIASLPNKEYICLRKEGNSLSEHDRVMFLKGYLSDGFADKVFHIHVRYPGNYDELYFRDYLISHPEAAVEYTDLKRNLFKDYEHDRDGYTAAKGAFIKKITDKARKEKST